MPALNVRQGARIVETLEVGTDLSAVALTCTLYDLDAQEVVGSPITLDNSPGVAPTSAILTLPAEVTATLDPTTRYWYKVETVANLILMEGHLFVAPAWPA